MTNYYTVLFSNKLLHKYIIIGFSAAGNNPTSGRAHLSIWVLAQFGWLLPPKDICQNMTIADILCEKTRESLS